LDVGKIFTKNWLVIASEFPEDVTILPDSCPNFTGLPWEATPSDDDILLWIMLSKETERSG